MANPEDKKEKPAGTAEKEQTKKKEVSPAAAAARAEAAAKGKKAKADKAASALKLVETAEVSPETTPRLVTMYKTKAVPALMKQFQFKNPMQVPRFAKVVINCAVKEAVGNPKVLDSKMDEIMAIAAQKPVLTRAKKAIATFKVRKGNTVGVMVTLRRARMYEFLDRLMNVALPRVRDFKGVNPKSFDGRGNYSLGIREQIIFPEVVYDKVDKITGMTITITTTAKTNEHARALLTEMGMPFRK